MAILLARQLLVASLLPITADTKTATLQTQFRHHYKQVVQNLEHKTGRKLTQEQHAQVRQHIKDKLYPHVNFDPHKTVLTSDQIKTQVIKEISQPYHHNSPQVQEFITKKKLENKSPADIKRLYHKHNIQQNLTKQGHILNDLNRATIHNQLIKNLTYDVPRASVPMKGTRTNSLESRQKQSATWRLKLGKIKPAHNVKNLKTNKLA